MSRNARFTADIRECPVAIVVKQPARPRLEDARNTIMMRAVLIDAAAARLVELRKLANEKVQPPIVVVIEPHRARTPSWSRDAGLLRNIRESPVTIIMIEDAAAVLRHVHRQSRRHHNPPPRLPCRSRHRGRPPFPSHL